MVEEVLPRCIFWLFACSLVYSSDAKESRVMRKTLENSLALEEMRWSTVLSCLYCMSNAGLRVWERSETKAVRMRLKLL